MESGPGVLRLANFPRRHGRSLCRPDLRCSQGDAQQSNHGYAMVRTHVLCHGCPLVTSSPSSRIPSGCGNRYGYETRDDRYREANPRVRRSDSGRQRASRPIKLSDEDIFANGSLRAQLCRNLGYSKPRAMLWMRPAGGRLARRRWPSSGSQVGGCEPRSGSRKIRFRYPAS